MELKEDEVRDLQGSTIDGCGQRRDGCLGKARAQVESLSYEAMSNLKSLALGKSLERG